jgi:hypothetical protein
MNMFPRLDSPKLTAAAVQASVERVYTRARTYTVPIWEEEDE